MAVHGPRRRGRKRLDLVGAAPLVERRVDDGAPEPSVERAVAPEARARPNGLRERLLDGVAAGLAVAQDRCGKARVFAEPPRVEVLDLAEARAGSPERSHRPVRI